MPNIESRWGELTQHKRLLIVVMGSLLVALILALVIWLSLRSADSRDYSSAKSRLDQARASRNFDIGIEAMNGYLHGGFYRTHKYEAYLLIGSMYEMKQDYEQALAAYRLAEGSDVKGNGAELEAIARVSEKLGDKTTAAHYYQKVLDAVPDNAPAADSTRGWLKAKIKKLQAATS